MAGWKESLFNRFQSYVTGILSDSLVNWNDFNWFLFILVTDFCNRKASPASSSLSFTIIITNGDSPSSSIITNEWPNDQLPKLLLKHAYASETITGFISPTSISCKTTKKTTIAIIRTSQESKIALTSQN